MLPESLAANILAIIWKVFRIKHDIEGLVEAMPSTGESRESKGFKDNIYLQLCWQLRGL